MLMTDPGLRAGEPAPDQPGGATHLPCLSACPRAGEGGEHTVPAPPAHPHPGGDSHCESEALPARGEKVTL